MSRLGIRKKILSALGRSSAPSPSTRPAKPAWPVTFVLRDGSEYDAEAKQHDSLVFASNRGPKPIATGCADGTCATCRVEVLAGGASLAPPDAHEARTKKLNGVDETLRLGCQTAVVGPGVRVRIVNVLGEELAT